MRTIVAPAGRCPVPVIDTTEEAVRQWVGDLMDHYADKGDRLAFTGVILFASRTGEAKLVQMLKELYPSEYEVSLAEARAAMRLPTKSEKNDTGNTVPDTGRVLVTDATKTVTQGERGGKRYTLFGHPVTAVLRWMGTDAWTVEQSRAALTAMGIEDVADATLTAQLRAGRKGERGPAAELTEDQINQLYKTIGQ